MTGFTPGSETGMAIKVGTVGQNGKKWTEWNECDVVSQKKNTIFLKLWNFEEWKMRIIP